MFFRCDRADGSRAAHIRLSYRNLASANDVGAFNRNYTCDYRYEDDINLVLNFLSRILDINTTAQLDSALHGPVQLPSDLLVPITAEATCSPASHEPSLLLDKICRHLGLSSDLPTLITILWFLVLPKARFAITCKPPGGRHDNDSDNISEIQVLPNQEDIKILTGE